MSKFTDDIETILRDPRYHAQCMQIAPFGRDHCALLFELGTQDHDLAYSVVFEVSSFAPGTQSQTLKLDEWLISLTSPSLTNLFALEVGRVIWRYSNGGWTSQKVTKNLMQRVWSYNDDLTLLVGDDGQSWAFDGNTWSALKADRRHRLRDVHGPRRDLIHCVGQLGTLQRLADNGWQAINLPIENDLWGVFVTPDGVVRACGNDGTCIRVVNEEMVELEAPKSRFFCVHQFQGEIYWGDSEYGIYRERGNQLVQFHPAGTGWDMRSDAEYLYLVGGGIAWRFDGKKWNSLQLDYDGSDLRLIQ
ncbi:hypothetical protein [Mesorhizobium sp.]|uniref:hypothetical protein n=1 Tax=Mesorhizobium sp. TaxID=1871066 RepID=UPI000FE30C5B|nr:hypothetical protein [Mesorhizobium sp.]RWO01968.1 MAG: hypothetical protein EOS06_07120 [Mesorhizobium sp.]